MAWTEGHEIYDGAIHLETDKISCWRIKIYVEENHLHGNHDDNYELLRFVGDENDFSDNSSSDSSGKHHYSFEK